MDTYGGAGRRRGYFESASYRRRSDDPADFCEIYEAVAKIGFILTVYTNATMVTDKVMELFQKYPPHKIGVTMYGASNETYARLCGCKDGYDRFMVGLEKLSSLPSLLEMRTTIVKG